MLALALIDGDGAAAAADIGDSAALSEEVDFGLADVHSGLQTVLGAAATGALLDGVSYDLLPVLKAVMNACSSDAGRRAFACAASVRSIIGVVLERAAKAANAVASLRRGRSHHGGDDAEDLWRREFGEEEYGGGRAPGWVTGKVQRHGPGAGSSVASARPLAADWVTPVVRGGGSAERGSTPSDSPNAEELSRLDVCVFEVDAAAELLLSLSFDDGARAFMAGCGLPAALDRLAAAMPAWRNVSVLRFTLAQALSGRQLQRIELPRRVAEAAKGQGGDVAGAAPAPAAIDGAPAGDDVPVPAGSPPKWVFISYCWRNQPAVLTLAAALKRAGVPVWLDVERMADAGGLLEGMADGLEGAALVIACISPDYSASPACRAEVAYAGQLRRRIVPAKVAAVDPRGWLGVAVSGLLYFDLTGGCGEGTAAATARLVAAVASAAPAPASPSEAAAAAKASADATELAMDPPAVAAWLARRGVSSRLCDAAAAAGIDGLTLRGLRVAARESGGVAHAITAAAAMGLRPLDAYAIFAALLAL